MSLDITKHILLFENCQLIKGHSRTLLVDFQRRNLEFIDNEIYNILAQKNRELTVNEILESYSQEEKETITEYLEFLLEKEYAFQCASNEVPFFPKISLEWDNPAIITNCIIDFEIIPNDFAPYLNLISDLEKLGCEDIQIRAYNEFPIDFFRIFLPNFNSSIIQRIEILLKYSESLAYYKNFVKAFPRICKLQLYSAPRSKVIELNKTQQIILRKQKISNKNSCGIIDLNFFNLRLEHFCESNHYNTCLNRKVSIDADGNIKNCPSLKTSFGNINDTRIVDVIKQKNFTKIWKIKKDNIEVCKDCEFRHICTDCRAYHKSDYSLKKPTKCFYSPYLDKK